MKGDHLLDSGALQTLNRVLGATGGSQHTRIDSDVLQTVMDMVPIVRRGRTFAGSEGLFMFGIENTHTAIDETITSSVDPYNLGTLAGAGLPRAIEPGWDVWLLYALIRRTGANVNLDSAILDISYPAALTGFVSPAGSQFGGLNVKYLISETENVLGGGTLGTYLTELGSGEAGQTLAMRIPRGATIRLRTRTGNAAGVFPVYFASGLIGVFPAGLGQDAIGTG